MSAKNDCNKQWMIWALGFYTDAWDEFKNNNSENIPKTTVKIQTRFLEHLKEKLSHVVVVSNVLLTEEKMPTQISRNFTSLAINNPRKWDLELTNVSLIPKIQTRRSVRPTHQCNICLKSFTEVISLGFHMKTHDGGERVVVASTPLRHASSAGRRTERSTSPEQLLAYGLPHIQEESQGQVEVENRNCMKSKEKLHECPDCGKKFAWKHNLIQHKRIHSGIKPFNCDQCDKCFTLRGNLTVHRRIHTGEKPFKCSDCRASFTNTSDLARHRRIHSGIKPYKCDVCKKAFSRNGDLRKHRRIHTGEKPYECNQCSKCFSQSSNLNKHLLFVHSDDEKHACEFCETTFKRKSLLTKHQEQYHPTGQL